MTDNRDLVRTLEKLRPVSTVPAQWPAAARDATLDRLLTAAGSAPPPTVHARGRRILLTTALAAGFVASGAGVAAAAGLLPESFTRPLSFWASETGGAVHAQQARRVAQAPGPDGQVLSVWTATSPDGTTCVAPLFEPPGELDRPAPANFRLAGGQCAPADPDPKPFSSLGGSADEHGTHTMWASAGTAARAELRLPDGTVRPVLAAEGMFFFWYVANERIAPPTLIGYAPTGAVVAERPLIDMETLSRPRSGG